MSSEANAYLENALEDLGGCGRFQFLLNFFVLGTKTVVAWSTLMMSFGGAVPEWSCTWHTNYGTYNTSLSKRCSITNSSVNPVCVERNYDSSMSTVVNQWDLVCDREWIISTITTIQMGGLLLGALISGQIGDTFGRKRTYILSVVTLMVANLIAAFSVNWQMFAVLRFFIGMGCGWYLTVFGIFVVEFTPAKYRALVLAFPTWSIGTMLFGLCAWLIPNWKYVQIATAVFCVPWMIGFCLIQESYRWLVANNKLEEAYNVTVKVSKINGKSHLNKDGFFKVLSTSENKNNKKKYTFVDILRNRRLVMITLSLMLSWLSCGYGFYAISFGVQQLSGNLYLNVVLLGLMDLASLSISFFANCFGRKWTTLLLFTLAGLTGCAVGVIQFIDVTDKGKYINGIALACKVFVATGWTALWIFTSENYPTVVRNVGMGVNNSTSRVGAMVAPQLVFASKRIPGISYLLLGVLFLLSALCILCLEETNNKTLQDSIEIVIERPTDNNKSDSNDTKREKDTRF